MPSHYEVTSAGVINAFAWDTLKTEGILAGADYNFTPFIPSQQVPEFTELNPNVPFIVYADANVGSGTRWFQNDRSLTYVVYSTNSTEVISLVQFFEDVFRRYDDSAVELNQWLLGQSDIYKSFTFNSLYVQSSVTLNPAETEGGRYNGLLSIRYTYTTPTETNGRRRLA